MGLLASVAQAKDADDGEPMNMDTGEAYFYYRISCSSYLEQRASLKNAQNQTANIYYVTGWLSAYNRFHAQDEDITPDTDIPGVMLWLENYCRQTPLGTLEAGLVRLTAELHEKNTRHSAPPAVGASPSAIFGK